MNNIVLQDLAEALLSEAWGGVVRLDNEQPLGHNARTPVSRWNVAQSPASAPPSVVIKCALQEEDAKFSAERHFFDEWAGLEFLARCFEGVNDLPAPRFIAADAEARMIIMQDIGSGIGLEDYLLGDNPQEAANALVSMWAALGRIHSIACGRQDEYYMIRDALIPRETDSEGDRAKEFFEEFTSGLAKFGVAPLDGSLSEVKEVFNARFEDGPFRTFIHRDACPGNILWINGRAMVYDLGFSSMLNASHEMCVPRMAFNTCFYRNRIPREVLDRIEAEYRRELSDGCPAARDDSQFWRQMAAGCAYTSLHFISRPDDIWWLEWQVKEAKLGRFGGIQHILARLDGFVDVSEKHDTFPLMGQTANAVAENIRARLPKDFLEMPVFPAFR